MQKKSKAYKAIPVNNIQLPALIQGRQGQHCFVGCDVGKFHLLVVLRWPDGEFTRPWRVNNPEQVTLLVELLSQLQQHNPLQVALEPSGTYGDALRQALQDANLTTLLVSPKIAHDYAEVFDGVPSQHDGKDAAVLAELASLGKAREWSCQPAWQQELDYWIGWLNIHQGSLDRWLGRLEGLLARHWPEATRVLPIKSPTLLQALAHYGDPGLLAGDEEASAKLARWGRKFLSQETIDKVLQSASDSVGVRLGEWPRLCLQEYAKQALAVRQQKQDVVKKLRALVRRRAELQGQAAAVGAVTTCVLWSALGDPKNYPCGEAYRKAMGLNLRERSSGEFQGRVRLSKRGQPAARRWLYLAALRQVQKAGLREWYQARKAKDRRAAKLLLVAVMRKLALALYQVGAKGKEYSAARLFPGQPVKDK